MNKYQITTEKKKNAIVNAALNLFKNKGFTNVSIKEIAAHAHVSQVSIYNYFGSKETLVGECVMIVIGDTLQQAADILTQEIAFTEKIKLALSLCTEKINLSVSEFFTQDALKDTTFVELLLKNINENKNKIYREYIALGKKEHVINANIPTETFLDFIEALNVIGSKSNIADDTSEKMNQLHHLFLYGMIGMEPQRK